MEAERSIVLQKKTILFLSLIIGAVFGIIYAREVKVRETNTYISNLDIVTVNVPEDENEVLKENVKYLMAEVINEESFNTLDYNNEKIEVFAGDVERVADEDVAVNEATNETTPDENMEEIIIKNEEVTETENDEIQTKTENVEQTNKETEEVNNNANQVAKETKTVRYRDLAEDNPPEEYERIVEASATAYCLCKKCCGKSEEHPYYGYTCSGIKITKGSGIKVIAVDPKVIPLNTKVYVEGLNGAWDYGHAIAADTGSAIKELKIDLYMDTHEEALQWGRRKVNVYVLGE